MSESEDVFQNDDNVWDYIKEHPKQLGLPISNKTGLDLLSAMRDVYLEMDRDTDRAKDMLTMLATVLLAASAGLGDKVIEEVLVQEAMFGLDEAVEDILNEK